MEKPTQETVTETKQLSLTDDNISQADYERLRAGETVEVQESAPAKVETKASETPDESEALETDGDEVDESEDSDVEMEAKPKKKSGTQRRIEKLVKQRAEAEREREYWREQAMKAQPKAEAPKEVAKPVAEGRPKSDDFETHDDYVEAIADWKAEQKLQAAKQADRDAKLKAEADSKSTEFRGKVQEFKKATADFDDVIADVDDVPMSLAVSQAILESDDGPQLMYELAKNREEYERICQLPALQAARAIGRFEAKLSKPSASEKPEVKQKQTTRAPAPARPISASSANGKMSIDDPDISQRDYERLRAEQEKRRASY